MDNYTVGQRVVTQVDNKYVKIGTIATLTMIEKGMGVIQYDFDEKEKYVAVPLYTLKPATKEDLKLVSDYKKIVSSKFHLNKMFSTESNISLIDDYLGKQIITIVNIEGLDILSQNDTFQVNVKSLDGQFSRETSLSASFILEYLIDYIPEIEEQLYGELSDEGHFFELNPGIRVKMKKDVIFFNNEAENKELKMLAGSVGVLLEEIDGILVVAINDNGFQYTATITAHDVSPATQEEIGKIGDKDSVVDIKLQLGSILKAINPVGDISPNDIINIVEVSRLGESIWDDLFLVNVLNRENALIEIKTNDLYFNFTQASMDDLESIETKSEQNVSLSQDIEKTEDDNKVLINSLTIGDEKFTIDHEFNHINIKTTITIDGIDSYIRKLEKLRDILLQKI